MLKMRRILVLSAVLCAAASARVGPGAGDRVESEVVSERRLVTDGCRHHHFDFRFSQEQLEIANFALAFIEQGTNSFLQRTVSKV